MQRSSLFSPPCTFELSPVRRSSQLLVLGGLLAIGSSLLTLTPVMAAGIQNLADFNGANGSKPSASLTLGTDGLFYGTTEEGGSSDHGTIFSINPTGSVITSLASFNGTNGARPSARLTLGTNGLFYGTSAVVTVVSGSSDVGTIFSFNPTGNVLSSSLAIFNGSNGYDPYANLTLGTDGLFYGTTTSGFGLFPGTIFSFNPTGNVLTALASFGLPNDSFASLTLGTDGLFYGTTEDGGSSGDGTIFSFNPTGNVFTALASFDGANGSNSFASLTLGTDGLFYGTAFNGGSSNDGTIFSFNPTGNVLTSLVSFDGANGSKPSASLTLGTDGLFYGTTFFGGSSDNGTIFSFNPTGNVLTSLASFNGANGRYPTASLTLGTNGLFYGTTFQGGSSDAGTIFSFNPNSETLVPSTPVPEPSALLGMTIAVALGVSLKRKPA